MELVKNNFKNSLKYLKTLVKWLIVSVFVGAAGGCSRLVGY